MRNGLLSASLLAGLAACAAPADMPVENRPAQPIDIDTVTVQGSALYRERIALPPTARLIVEIRDVSLMDAPSTLIASTEVASEGRQVPIGFSINYDPGRIDPKRRYAVSARIMDGEQLLWITDTHVGLPPPESGPITLNLVSARR